MTKSAKNRRRKDCSNSEAASLEFNAVKWGEDFNSDKALRGLSGAMWIAVATCAKSKTELVEMLETIDDKLGEKIFDELREGIELAEAMVKMMKSADARLIIAGSAALEKQKAV